MVNLKEILSDNKPWVVLSVGTPLVGKTTLFNDYFKGLEYKYMSTDEIMMELSHTRNYDDAWKIAHSENFEKKSVEKKLKKELMDLGRTQNNVVIDMTSLTKKSRHKHLAKFPKHFKVAIVFDILTDEEYILRNEKRKKEENKSISLERIKDMKENYKEISKDEMFNLVLNVKDLI